MDDTELQKAKEAALAYNRTLIPGVADNLSFSEEALKSAAENYENLLNISGDGIIGYVEIPKIDVNLPIYHAQATTALTGASDICSAARFRSAEKLLMQC